MLARFMPDVFPRRQEEAGEIRYANLFRALGVKPARLRPCRSLAPLPEIEIPSCSTAPTAMNPRRHEQLWLRAILALHFAVRGYAVCHRSHRRRNAHRRAVRLSLDEAIRIAQAQSQPVEIARAGITRAHGRRGQAHSQYLPQLNANGGYARTLESQFSAIRQRRVDSTPTHTETAGRLHAVVPDERHAGRTSGGARAVGDVSVEQRRGIRLQQDELRRA